jgi:hypothetical protein
MRFSSPRKVSAVLVVVGLVLLWSSAVATAQQDSSALEQRKAKLEVQKLELEARKLELEARKLDDELGLLSKWGQTVLTVFGSVFVGFVAAGASMQIARRNARAAERAARQRAFATLKAARRSQKADLDQATHQKRLESYPGLVTATSPLAIYFPDLTSSTNMKSLDPHTCGAIGCAISKWYFKSGLLLSGEARDAYFRLARALTLASCAEKLYVPHFPDDAKGISAEKVDQYRDLLGIKEPNDETIEKWEFGNPPTASVGEEKLEFEGYRFKDYVLLQTLSSRLRTMLSEDIRSRRRPVGKARDPSARVLDPPFPTSGAGAAPGVSAT